MEAMTEIVNRTAGVDDAGAVAAVIADVVAGPNPAGFDAAMPADQVVHWIERLGRGVAVFLAEREGEVLWFGTLDFNTQEPERATLGVWIRSAHQRQGIGTVLAEYSLEHARKGGFKRIVGRLPEDNEPALSFLSAIGGLAPIMNTDARFELPL